MLWLKACPRCKGDLLMERDHYGAYIACAQCGYYLTAEEEAVLRTAGGRRPAGQRRAKRAAGAPARARTA